MNLLGVLALVCSISRYKSWMVIIIIESLGGFLVLCTTRQQESLDPQKYGEACCVPFATHSRPTHDQPTT